MSTSKLQRYVSNLLSTYLGEYTIRENYRPDWLIGPKGERLELDFFIEELGIAIEVQGMQHYAYIPHFHGEYENFQRHQQFDQTKKNTCLGYDIELHEVFDEQSALSTVEKITTPVDIPESLDFTIAPNTEVSVFRAIYRIEGALKGINDFSSRPLNLLPKTRKRYITRLTGFRSCICNLMVLHAQSILIAVGNERTQYYVASINLADRTIEILDSIFAEQRAERNRLKWQKLKEKSHTPEGRKTAKAKRLMIEPVDLFTYRVWGGENEHRLTVTENGVVCDCDGFEKATNRRCAHVVRFELYRDKGNTNQ